MDFATFTAETLEFLWRDGDAALQARMPKIVRSAEARLRTDLKLTDEDKTVLISVTASPFDKPTDADIISSISWEDVGPATFTSSHDFQTATGYKPLVPGAIHNRTMEINQLLYTVEGKRIYHRRPASEDTPIEARLVYTPLPASLVDDDDTLFNAYRDLYELAVYAEACASLLDTENEAKYAGRYGQRLEAARIDQSHRKFAGGPLRMQMPGVVV